MKKFFGKFVSALNNEQAECSDAVNENVELSLLGSWRLVGYVGYQMEMVKPHWREVWSFAAMDEAETNGVYVCDYINLHSIVGKWEVVGDCIKLIRKELVREYRVVELTANSLQLKATDDNEFLSSIQFCRDI